MIQVVGNDDARQVKGLFVSAKVVKRMTMFENSETSDFSEILPPTFP